jgi:putative transposase
MTINNDLLDQLLADYQKPEDILGENGLLKQLTKAVLERAMQAELTHHLGYPKHSPSGQNSGNSRNGKSKKTLKGDFGSLPIEVPRDRNATFEPQIVPKGQTRFEGFDDKILSLYARGMTTRQIKQHLEEIYQVEVSPSLISSVTDAITDEVKAWQSRPLDAVYPIIYLDALVVKVRDSSHIQNKAIHLIVGINTLGRKEALGLWVTHNEGAKFWLQVLTDLKNRGVRDIFIACVDGLTGFPEAVEAAYPKTEVQLCIVHQVRNSLKYVSWKWRKEVAEDLKAIYTSATVDEAELQLEAFSRKWDEQLPTISKSWKLNWDRLVPFMSYPEDIRRVIYTTNAIESVNSSLRKVLKNRGSFPNEDAVIKLVYLALRNISAKWSLPIRDWALAMNRFAIMFEGRMPLD